MRIAQHSVAGEAASRPQTPDVPAGAQDQQALEEYACDRSNLPWVIFRAAHRATHTAALPARARALLAALARTVDAARPYAAIFARRELLTGRAMQSMRTFYRSLDDLEAAGFISRPPQMRYGGAGLFGRAYIHLTPKAAALLGLIEPASETDADTLIAASPVESSKAETDLSFAPPSVTVADGAIYKDLNPTTQKRQPGRVPADLQRLLPLGFREFLIFKLMREAKHHGKLLSDVVEASWDHLRGATHPISYLRTLLRAPVDFTHRVRARQAAVTAREQQRERAQHVESAVANLAGEAFVSRDGVRTYHIAADARSITIRHRDESQPRIHAGNWAHDFLAAVEAGHIVRAAPEASHGDLSTEFNRVVTAERTMSAHTATRPFEAQINDLKQILRLKRAGDAPTNKPRDDIRPQYQRKRSPFPLNSLLQVLSGVAPSRA
ncbi:hypothetical protein AWB83_00398 [Caballeronia ptereochthonis]|uniref:Replication protein O n=2 Tax=Caballeronia ptereochthonis TaxID=1777144 RepID=A0A157ZBU1_9BURK|nr:hypothetical protein AWB83_00398 [Caballeronia ptereochthonis]